MKLEGRIACLLLLSVCLASNSFAEPATPEVVPAPFTFSDPDGLELDLESLTVRAAVSGPMSLTEMEMVFRNPRDRRTEGRFSCVLPEDAAISRFAKEVGGRLMEGEVVERLQANRIYEDILNQRRDPALLEQDQGNRFAVKIFPIEARASVRLLLSWSRLLPDEKGTRTFTVPLRGLSRIGSFEFVGHFSRLPSESSGNGSLTGDLGDASISTSQEVTFEKSSWLPDRDISFQWKTNRKDILLRAGDDWIAVIHPATGAATRTELTRPLVFYVDTSASTADGLLQRIRALEALLEGLGDREVEVFAFDQDVARLASGRGRDLAGSIGTALLKRGFLGATDIAVMLRHLSGLASDNPDRTFVVVSDGSATIGQTASSEIARAAESLPSGVNLHAVVLGSRRDDATLRTITEGRGRIISVPFSKDLEASARAASSRLVLPLGESVTLGADEADFVWPQLAEDLSAGAEVIVVGKSHRGASPGLFVVGPAGRRHRIDIRTETLPDRFAPLLEREAARGYLDLLARRERDETVPALRQALIVEQVRVSIGSRVVIPRTTMLVLESENDYVRFHVDRNALGRILTIGPGGIDILARSRTPVVSNQSVIRPGTLSGRAIHEGAPLPGVTVTVSSPALQGTRVAVTNVNGMYSFPALPPGQYRISLEMEGMGRVQAAANVTRDGTAWIGDTSLQLSAMSEAITLTAASPSALETTEVQSNFSSEVIDRLPVARTSQSTSNMAAGNSSAVAEAITVTAATPTQLEDSAIRTTVVNGRPFQGSSPPAYRPSQSTIQRWLSPSRKSLGTLEDAVKNDPTDRDARSALAEELAAREKWPRLIEVTREWQQRDASNPQVYELIGEAAIATGDRLTAARAFGSLVETAAANPELVQRAGMLLFRIGSLELAESALRLARESRPDRVNAWRHLALVVWQSGRHEEAASILEEALDSEFSARQQDVGRVMREELGYVLRDWTRVEPDRKADIARVASDYGVDLGRHDALRITLAWDTDANDVDLHVIDPSGEEVYFEHTHAKSSLELYEDITRGFGPEVVRAEKLEGGTYQVGVNYYGVGPMGVSRGIVVVIRENDAGRASVKVLPFRLRPEGESVMKVATLKM